MTRGQRNNNPLNIRRIPGVTWKGQSPEQTDKAFVQFRTMEWGLRAAFCILRTYARRHNIRRLADILRRWAPPAENDTDAYLHSVCQQTGFTPKQLLTESDWPTLVRAMARQESNQLLTDAVLLRAYYLYKLY